MGDVCVFVLSKCFVCLWGFSYLGVFVSLSLCLKVHFGEKRQTLLHCSVNQMAHSSQNPLILPNTLIIFSFLRLANLGMTCQQQMLTLHIQVYLTKLLMRINPIPSQNLAINNVEIEHDEETKQM